MDVAAIADASTRLLQAFEKMGSSPGEGLAGNGPSPVPRELARQFEDLLQEGGGAAPAPSAAGSSRAESVSPDVGAGNDAGAVEKASGADAAEGIPAEPVLLSPTELYSLQFHVAMLRFTAETGSQLQQKTAQGFDSLLRTQS